MAKAKIWSAEKSAKNCKADASLLIKKYNAAWGVAPKSALFLRRPKMVGTGKNKKRATMKNTKGVEVPVPQKANRALRTPGIKTLFSGAAAEVTGMLKREAEQLKTPIEGELKVAASLPSLSKPAELAFEHALSAYAQTIFSTALGLKTSIGQHDKISAGAMSAAAEIVNSKVFASASLAPGIIVPMAKKKLRKKRSKSKEDDPAIS